MKHLVLSGVRNFGLPQQRVHATRWFKEPCTITRQSTSTTVGTTPDMLFSRTSAAVSSDLQWLRQHGHGQEHWMIATRPGHRVVPTAKRCNSENRAGGCVPTTGSRPSSRYWKLCPPVCRGVATALMVTMTGRATHFCKLRNGGMILL